MTHLAFIGIGSNLGDPQGNCRKAIGHLANHPEISLEAKSPFYETQPVGPVEQNWFVNAVVKIRTSMEPLELLQVLMNIERGLGRVREEKWGPRTIDLDLLFYDDRILSREGLTLPHPEIARRRFVLAPLCDIAGDLVHPVTGKTAAVLLDELADDTAVNRLPGST